ncbi:MAG: ABC transporter substrate-binding protein [Reinekea sp.]|nr:ABC transporter substrate-binding protein [Reinekea sp.]
MPHFLKAAAFFAAATLTTLCFAQTQYPLTIQDGMGQEITLTSAPKTISSKTLFTDEILLNLLDASRLSSLTNFASDDNFSNIAEKLPAGVPLLDFNVEAIIGNYPDIVFAANWSDAGKVEQLKQAGIQVYLVNTPNTLEGIEAEILKLGMLLNVAEEAEQLVAAMHSRLESYQSKVSIIAKQQWVALDYNSWGTASGVDTTWNAVLTNAGIINGSAEYEQGAYGQVPMSKELIVEIDPDILFLPGWIYGESDAASSFYNQVANDPALSTVTAIKQGRVYQIPENLRGTYSQYIVDTIGYVVESVADAVE